MKKSRAYLSMPIISVNEGQQIGSVRGLIINPTTMEVAAMLVDQKGFFKEQRVIPYSKVKSVGDHAITVDRVTSVQKAVNLPETVSLLKDKVPIINAKVITESGRVLGTVEEFYIDQVTGGILSLEIANNFVSGLVKGRACLNRHDLITIGKDVIIASAGAEENLVPVETGLSETLKSVVDSTSNLWYSSVQKTKELSKHVARGKERIELTPPVLAHDDTLITGLSESNEPPSSVDATLAEETMVEATMAEIAPNEETPPKESNEDLASVEIETK